jgi:hypothetical protein
MPLWRWTITSASFLPPEQRPQQGRDQFYQKFLDETEGKHAMAPLAVRGKEQVANARALQATPLNYAIFNVGPKSSTTSTLISARCYP